MNIFAVIALLLQVSSQTVLEGASPEVSITPYAVTGEVTSVTLYSLEARVERTLAIDSGATGLRQIVVGSLPPTIYDSSIQVEGSENLVSVSVQVQRSSGEPVESDRVKQQRVRLEELRQALLRLQREDQSLKDMRERFASILPQRPDDEDSPPSIDLDAWQGLLDMVQQGMERAATGRAALAPQLRELQNQVEQAQGGLDQLVRTEQRSRTDVHLGIQDLTGAGGVIRISYLIPGASWRPHYEVDVDTDSGTLQLRAFAVVRQLTGEDWPEIPVSFSTSAPEQGSDIPELTSIRLERERYQDLVLARRKVAFDRGLQLQEAYNYAANNDPVPATEAGSSTRLGAVFFGREITGQSHVLPADSNRGFLRIFSSVKSESIPSDGESHRLLYAIQQLEFQEDRICVPEFNTAVFRRMKSVLSGSDPIIQGSVAVFLGEDYLGQTSIETTAPGEELTLDLGVDDQIMVQRVQRESEDHVGIFSKSVHYRTDLDLVIDNFHAEPVTILVRERIPFSESDQLRVRIDHAATTDIPEGVDADDGLLSWNLEIPPGEPTRIEFAWWIEAPPDMRLTRREAPERLGRGE